MSIDSNGINNTTSSEIIAETAKPVALGALPTAIAGIVKAPIPTAFKVGALVCGGLFFGLSIPHEHPPEFRHPETQKPLQKGDEVMHEGRPKRVVGYTGHHASVFERNTTSKRENGDTEVQMRDQPLWTGDYKLVAGSYGAGAGKKVGLVLADSTNFERLHKHDISGEGPFQSFDASKAIAISSEGQHAHGVVIVNPIALELENTPGFIPTTQRVAKIFREKGAMEGTKTVLDPKTVQILQNIGAKMHHDSKSFK